MTPLHIAVINFNLDVIIILINSGANLFVEDQKRNVSCIIFLS
jgi:ankyrin repeat protein